MRERRNVLIRGLVQGVGFREMVRRIALRFAVAGFVRNVGYELVEIDVEGEGEVVEAFLDTVFAQPPREARIDSVERRELAPGEAREFRGRAEPARALGGLWERQKAE